MNTRIVVSALSVAALSFAAACADNSNSQPAHSSTMDDVNSSLATTASHNQSPTVDGGASTLGGLNNPTPTNQSPTVSH